VNDTLDRFLQAQEGHYAQALAELEAGRKTSHWIWFVLPQLRGLGRSATAQAYGIAGRAEAEVYLAHPVLASACGNACRPCWRMRASRPNASWGTWTR